MDAPIYDLTTLPDWEPLLRTMHRELYEPSFPNPDEREEPDDWISRLELNQPQPPQPVTYILVTGKDLTVQGQGRQVVEGFLIAELYQQSSSALLTYLAVADSSRRRGFARQLMAFALGLLKTKVRERGRELQAIFAEVHDPHVVEERSPLDRYARVSVMIKLGAQLVPIQYVQPALRQGQRRVRSLQLFAFPLNDRLFVKIRTDVVRSFLREFYQAEGITDPNRDADFARMIGAHTREDIQLIAPLVEESFLSFHTYAVAFHFFHEGHVHPLKQSAPAFQSFECDMLAFSHRNPQPFYSEVLDELAQADVYIVFPEALTYTTEGNTKELLARVGDEANRRIRVRLHASRTVFRQGVSDAEVLHLAPIRK